MEGCVEKDVEIRGRNWNHKLKLELRRDLLKGAISWRLFRNRFKKKLSFVQINSFWVRGSLEKLRSCRSVRRNSFKIPSYLPSYHGKKKTLISGNYCIVFLRMFNVSLSPSIFANGGKFHWGALIAFSEILHVGQVAINYFAISIFFLIN